MTTLLHLPAFSLATIVPVVIAISIGSYFFFLPSRFQFSSKAPQKINGYPIVGAIDFFTKRWEFFQNARSRAATGNFSFFIGKHPVVGLTGDKSRQMFFDSRDLGFEEGYSVLFGQSPNATKKSLKEIDPDFGTPGGFFVRRLNNLLKTNNLSKILPKLKNDVQKSMKLLANDPKGVTDPFENIYYAIFQLTMRTVGCDDIADNQELMDKMLKLYTSIDRSATPTAIMFPWFPSPAVVKRTIAGGKIYMIINKIVDERKKSGVRGDDALQYLMDQGDSVFRMIEFIVGALFAGLLNSGINTAWLLTYLSNDPCWRAKTREEIISVAGKYSPNKNAPLLEQLDYIPVEAWEGEFPLIDLCLKETIRLQALGTAIRRNVSGKELSTGVKDEIIQHGVFVTYALADVHMDPEVYADPERWDPSRYLPERAEDKKKPYAYLGWGVGRHPCVGMRFAKLEANVILAYFIASFDYELSDKLGNPTSKLPPVDYNSPSAAKPNPTGYIKYTRRT